MDTNPPLPQPEQPVVPPYRSAFANKRPSSIAFIVALLLFLLPFVDIRCNGMSMKQITGLQLAVGFKTGTDWDMNNQRMEVDENFDYKAKKEKRSRNKYALIALLLGITGLGLAYSDARKGGIGGMITGTAAVVSLILLFIDIKRNVKKSMASMDNNMDREMQSTINIQADFSAGFYLAVIAFLAAAYFSYWRWKANEK
jgi:hypothetical protein